MPTEPDQQIGLWRGQPLLRSEFSARAYEAFMFYVDELERARARHLHSLDVFTLTSKGARND